MQYAIIEAGSKQFRVQGGDILDIEWVGQQKALSFKALFHYDGSVAHVGSPHLDKCLVQVEVIGETKGPKVLAYKYKRRKSYRRVVGHRQRYSRIKVTHIATGGNKNGT